MAQFRLFLDGFTVFYETMKTFLFYRFFFLIDKQVTNSTSSKNHHLLPYYQLSYLALQITEVRRFFKFEQGSKYAQDIFCQIVKEFENLGYMVF